MKTIKKLETAAIVVIGIAAGGLSFNAGASTLASTEHDAQLIYQSQSINHSIFSYMSRLGGKLSLKPELIYVSLANGPAIYSYKHSGSETAVPWNVEYVDTAYGRAIYSYDTPRFNGEVKFQPITILH